MSAPHGDPAVGGDSGENDQSADPELTFAMFAGASTAAAAAPLPDLGLGQTTALLGAGGDLQHEIDAVLGGEPTFDPFSADAATAIGGYVPAPLPLPLRQSSRQASAADIDLLLMQSRHAPTAGKHATSRSRGSSRQSEVCGREKNCHALMLVSSPHAHSLSVTLHSALTAISYFLFLFQYRGISTPCTRVSPISRLRWPPHSCTMPPRSARTTRPPSRIANSARNCCASLWAFSLAFRMSIFPPRIPFCIICSQKEVVYTARIHELLKSLYLLLFFACHIRSARSRSTVFQQLQHARHATAAAVEKSAAAEKSGAALQQKLRASEVEAAQQRAATDAAAKEARKLLADARARIAELCVLSLVFVDFFQNVFRLLVFLFLFFHGSRYPRILFAPGSIPFPCFFIPCPSPFPRRDAARTK